MMSHPKEWLQAYYDGQLNTKRQQFVAEHLTSCQECQDELNALHSLSALLGESPAASNLLSMEIFVSQVGIQLPRKPDRLSVSSGLETGWRLAPFGMLGAWAFFQAVFIVTSVLLLSIRVIPGADQLLALLPGEASTLSLLTTTSGASLFDMGEMGGNLLGGIGPIGLVFTLNVGLTILIGMLYLSWLASWWIRNQNGQKIAINSRAA